MPFDTSTASIRAERAAAGGTAIATVGARPRTSAGGPLTAPPSLSGGARPKTSGGIVGGSGSGNGGGSGHGRLSSVAIVDKLMHMIGGGSGGGGKTARERGDGGPVRVSVASSGGGGGGGGNSITGSGNGARGVALPALVGGPAATASRARSGKLSAISVSGEPREAGSSGDGGGGASAAGGGGFPIGRARSVRQGMLSRGGSQELPAPGSPTGSSSGARAPPLTSRGPSRHGLSTRSVGLGSGAGGSSGAAVAAVAAGTLDAGSSRADALDSLVSAGAAAPPPGELTSRRARFADSAAAAAAAAAEAQQQPQPPQPPQWQQPQWQQEAHARLLAQMAAAEKVEDGDGDGDVMLAPIVPKVTQPIPATPVAPPVHAYTGAGRAPALPPPAAARPRVAGGVPSGTAAAPTSTAAAAAAACAAPAAPAPSLARPSSLCLATVPQVKQPTPASPMAPPVHAYTGARPPVAPPPVVRPRIGAMQQQQHPGGSAAAIAAATAATAVPAAASAAVAAALAAAAAAAAATPPSAPSAPGAPLCVSPHLPPAMARDRWRLADFQRLETLYEGHASSVYKARDLKGGGGVVALKLYDHARLNAVSARQVEREVRLHAGLRHEHVVALHAAFVERTARGGAFTVLVQEVRGGRGVRGGPCGGRLRVGWGSYVLAAHALLAQHRGRP